jgi:hypothetical protein
MTRRATPDSMSGLQRENISMSNADIFAAVFVVLIGAIAVYALGYFGGRQHGYRQGLAKGEKLNGQVQHLKGMTDGYVMALQHTPAQRNEYMNNVLLKIGAMTPAEIEARRQSRFRAQMGG